MIIKKDVGILFQMILVQMIQKMILTQKMTPKKIEKDDGNIIIVDDVNMKRLYIMIV